MASSKTTRKSPANKAKGKKDPVSVSTLEAKLDRIIELNERRSDKDVIVSLIDIIRSQQKLIAEYKESVGILGNALTAHYPSNETFEPFAAERDAYLEE